MNTTKQNRSTTDYWKRQTRWDQPSVSDDPESIRLRDIEFRRSVWETYTKYWEVNGEVRHG